MNDVNLRFLRPEAVLARTGRVRAAHDVVHVWPLSQEGGEEARRHCESLLSSAELERARRFFHEHHRRAFTIVHGLKRHVLGAYCGEPPASLEFASARHGKPELSGPPPARCIRFNLSHSHGRALLAVSLDREIGVDIEQENPRTNIVGIADNYFFGSEREAILTAPEGLRAQSFFRFWCAKEAVLKAQGSGLHAPLDSFEVRFEPDLATAHVVTHDETRITRGWRVRRLTCEPGWHAAVAALMTDWRIEVIEEP